jgi:hypothetical protein
MFRSFDAAYPPLTGYPGCAAAAGYIGGRTPHVWTGPEWRRFAGLKQTPIWVADLSTDGIASGLAAKAKAEERGWTATEGGYDVGLYGSAAFVKQNHPGWAPSEDPTRRVIWLDMETWVSKTFVDGFIEGAGGQLPRFAGYWIAAWNGQPDVPAGDVGHQFQPDVPYQRTQVDLSVWDGSMLAKFGYGPRGGA